MQDSLVITDLKNVPQFLEQAAHGIWLEWWKERDVSRDHIITRSKEALEESPVPTMLIAHSDEEFLGSVSLIASDMETRPHYTPWLAALLVMPDHQEKGHGVKLVQELEIVAQQAGLTELYLCALPQLRGFYEKLGWTCIEESVGDVDVFRKEL